MDKIIKLKRRCLSLHIVIRVCSFLFVLYCTVSLMITNGGISRKDEEPSDSAVYSYIYKNGMWGPGSGYGAGDVATEKYRPFLQKIFDNDRFESFVDLGCGDFQTMRHIKVPAKKSYTGIDVVPDVIDKLRRDYGPPRNANYKFVLIDDLKSLQLGSDVLVGVDLVIVKDVMQMWSNERVQYFIDNVMPNFKYALIVNHFVGGDDLNEEITTDAVMAGKHRPIDPTYPPFNLRNYQLEYRFFENGINEERAYLWVNPVLVGNI